MKTPVITDELSKTNTDPILIMDREGTIGADLYERIKEELLVVLAGGMTPKSSHNLIYLSYKKVIPAIPEGKYSLFIMISDLEKDLLDIASQLIKKAKQDGSKFIFITHADTVDTEQVNKILSWYEMAYVIVMGELLLAYPTKKHFSPIDSLLLDAGLRDEITLSHMGIRSTHALFFEDAVSTILQTIFGIQEQPKISLVFPKDPITELGIAHELQKTYPLIKINFSAQGGDVPIKEFPQIQGTHALPEPYPIKEKIKEVYKKLSTYKQEHQDILPLRYALLNETEQMYIPPVSKRISTEVVAYGIYIIAIMLILPFLIFGITAASGTYFLYHSKQDVQQGKLSQAKQSAEIANAFFTFSQNASYFMIAEFSFINQQSIIQPAIQLTSLAKELSALTVHTVSAATTLQGMLVGDTAFGQSDAYNAFHDIQNSIVSLQQIKQEGTLPQLLQGQLSIYDKSITMLANTSNLMPYALGFPKKKTYLILFQNNMELRPGGGFIGSYGLLTVDQGRITAFTIHDVYDDDGQMKKHIEPPFAIRRYIPVVHWYLRDSNFDVDFSQSAQAATYLLYQETGIVADGVIGTDLTLVKNILGVIGPVQVPEYNQTVNQDNFFDVTEKHAEENFFPGSTQKKDFLRYLFAAIAAKMQNKKNVLYNTFLTEIPNSIAQKHLLFAFSNSDYQKQLSLNNLSSSLLDTRQNSPGVINDFIGINDANIGVNKANYFLSRSITQQATLDRSGTIQETVSVTYTNKSHVGQWPGGDYKNYLRIILPLNTNLLDIAIDKDTENIINAVTDPHVYEAKNFIAPNGLEVEKTEEEGKTIYGFLVTIPANTTRTVTITYQLDQKSNLAYPAVEYNIHIFKQPGTDQDPYSFYFNYPDVYRVFQTNEQMTNNQNQTVVSTSLTTDKIFDINLAKK